MSKSKFDNAQAVYYLESIARNLKEFAEVASRTPGMPSIGSEILADNRDWLDGYVDILRKQHGRPALSAGQSSAPTEKQSQEK